MTQEDNRRTLAAAFRALKESDDALTASSSVEARLRAEVASLGKAARQSNGRRLGLGLAFAASLVLLVSSSIWWMAQIEQTSELKSTAARREVVTDFVPLPYATVPSRSIQIVRLEVSGTALASMGLASFDPPNPGSPTVLADVVIGEDGLARAVRFVRVLPNQE